MVHFLGPGTAEQQALWAVQLVSDSSTWAAVSHAMVEAQQRAYGLPLHLQLSCDKASSGWLTSTWLAKAPGPKWLRQAGRGRKEIQGQPVWRSWRFLVRSKLAARPPVRLELCSV